ncbi:hypothetical protein HY993_00995 [Candidatus Micrarchaeota archaeon]|nr:hypothetical protein [Candidatus Micrarchaeota archaeon]
MLFVQKADSQLYDGLLFVFLFAVFSTIFYAFFSITGIFLNQLAAYSSAFLISLFGSAGVSYLDGLPVIFGVLNGQSFSALIIDLCAGAIELSVLSGIVLASRDKTIKQRVFGVLGGFALFLAFNPIRIAVTLYFVGTDFLPFVHEWLFRGFLLALLIGYYALWYYGRLGFGGRKKGA